MVPYRKLRCGGVWQGAQKKAQKTTQIMASTLITTMTTTAADEVPAAQQELKHCGLLLAKKLAMVKQQKKKAPRCHQRKQATLCWGRGGASARMSKQRWWRSCCRAPATATGQ
jgi:hypothetical protein